MSISNFHKNYITFIKEVDLITYNKVLNDVNNYCNHLNHNYVVEDTDEIVNHQRLLHSHDRFFKVSLKCYVFIDTCFFYMDHCLEITMDEFLDYYRVENKKEN